MALARARRADPTPRLRNVVRLLDLKGWTQTELAKRSGLGTAYVNQLLTGRKKSPSLDALDRLASAFSVSSAVLIDQRLSDAELHTELSQGALRAALAEGISHAKFSRFRDTDEAPVTVEGWAHLARILEIADQPPRTPRSARASRARNAERQ